jgi:hypothetical protein
LEIGKLNSEIGKADCGLVRFPIWDAEGYTPWFSEECASPFETEACGQGENKSVEVAENAWVAGGSDSKKPTVRRLGHAGAIFYGPQYGINRILIKWISQMAE